jgi:hypothetical protein
MGLWDQFVSYKKENKSYLTKNFMISTDQLVLLAKDTVESVIYYRAMKTCEKAEAKLQILHLVLNAGR